MEINTMLNIIEKSNIKDIVCTYNFDIFNYTTKNIYPYNDARSASYAACGIAAEKNECVLLIVRDGAEARSAYSAMTEAYYKHMKIIMIADSSLCSLDYTKIINDAIRKVFVSNGDFQYCFHDAIKYIEKEKLPCLIQLKLTNQRIKNINLSSYNISFSEGLARIGEDNYLFVSNSINCNLPSHLFYTNSIVSKSYGVLSTIVGASFSKKRSHYFGVVTEEDFLHDINTLGNRCIADNITIFVLCEKNQYINNYAIDLGFICSEYIDNSFKYNTKKGKNIVFVKKS